MEDGDTEKYHPSRVIQDFVFLSRKQGCIRCISLQVYNRKTYVVAICRKHLLKRYLIGTTTNVLRQKTKRNEPRHAISNNVAF